jgi:hypothetical protein
VHLLESSNFGLDLSKLKVGVGVGGNEDFLNEIRKENAELKELLRQLANAPTGPAVPLDPKLNVLRRPP